MYPVGGRPTRVKVRACSWDRMRGGNEAHEVDRQSRPRDGEQVIGL